MWRTDRLKDRCFHKVSMHPFVILCTVIIICKASKKAPVMQKKPNTLFSTVPLFECLDDDKDAVKHRVAEIAEEDMRGMDIDALTTQVMAKLHIAALEIAGEDKFEQTCEKNGNQLTVKIPLTGDPPPCVC